MRLTMGIDIDVWLSKMFGNRLEIVKEDKKIVEVKKVIFLNTLLTVIRFSV